MWLLHVDLVCKPGTADELIAAYRLAFLPAIARQQGFLEATLLLARPPATDALRLVIAFESEELQKRWGASELHRQVWGRMQTSVARFSVAFFSHVS